MPPAERRKIGTLKDFLKFFPEFEDVKSRLSRVGTRSALESQEVRGGQAAQWSQSDHEKVLQWQDQNARGQDVIPSQTREQNPTSKRHYSSADK